MIDEHCGKNDIKELLVEKYKIGLNNQICKKMKTVQKMLRRET